MMVNKSLITLVIFCLSAIELSNGLAVMSVDLGSEFMKIAIVKPGVPMEIALNVESKRKTNVVVSMRNNERLFSDPALNIASKYPKFAYWFLLDLLGKTIDNPQVQLFKKRFPFYELHEDQDTKLISFKLNDELFSVEEILAMILRSAKSIAETFAEHPITDAVVTVPPFFNQAERRALLRAGDLANLKILQLFNDNTAVALNYGVFRRKAFNTTAVYYMFFDMGSSSTTATVVGYQIVKLKNAITGTVESNPQLTLYGVGYDRNLGGLEFQLRIRDLLAREFNNKKKSSNDIFKNERSMAKLFKEAGKVKHVLSSNKEYTAQVEDLMDGIDFRHLVKRSVFYELCKDLFEKVRKPVEDAIKASEITMGEIAEIILMGGSTRIPGVKEKLQEVTGRTELGMSINTDEAAALGAVYQAAHLSKGFKVKPFLMKEVTLFPIQVEFEKINAESNEVKRVKKTLFAHGNPYPQKKVMTFNKNVKDFGFEVLYSDLSHLSEEQRESFGQLKISKVSLSGVEEAYNKHASEAESKGVKAHFKVDESGLLQLEKVESTYEHKIPEGEGVANGQDESTLSKIGSYFFGPTAKEDEVVTDDNSKEDVPETPQEPIKEPTPGTEKETDSLKDEPKPTEPPTEEKKEETTTKPTEENTTEGTINPDVKPTESNNTKNETENKKEEKKITKPTLIKEPISFDFALQDFEDPSKDTLAKSKKILNSLDEKDQEKLLLEKAKNDLETLLIDTKDKLWQENYEKCSTEEERETLREKLNEADDWLYEADSDTLRAEYDKKRKDLQKQFKPIQKRVDEYVQRPEAIQALNSMVNHTEYFLNGMKNLTGEDLPFTTVEYTTLDKLLTESKSWNKSVNAEQDALPLTSKPAYAVEDVARKIGELDREMKYLLNKLKIFKPKVKETEKETTKKKSTKSKSGNSSENTSSKKDETITIDETIIPETIIPETIIPDIPSEKIDDTIKNSEKQPDEKEIVTEETITEDASNTDSHTEL